MYSNYLLSPNFEGTNVSTLAGGGGRVIFYFFKGFQCSAGSFLQRVGWRVSVTL